MCIVGVLFPHKGISVRVSYTVLLWLYLACRNLHCQWPLMVSRSCEGHSDNVDIWGLMQTAWHMFVVNFTLTWVASNLMYSGSFIFPEMLLYYQFIVRLNSQLTFSITHCGTKWCYTCSAVWLLPNTAQQCDRLIFLQMEISYTCVRLSQGVYISLLYF